MTEQIFQLKSKTEDIITNRADFFIRLNELKAQNARFMTITALDQGDDIEVVYHFERGIDVANIRVKALRSDPIPSITPVYPVALLAENEIQDLFNLKISGISVDFGGKLLKIEGADDTTLVKPAVGPVPFIKRFYGRCRESCPGMVDAPKYIRQVLQGDPQGGYSTCAEQAPLPAILGRVCFAPCQEGCRQERNDETIQIRLLKRVCADAMPVYTRKMERAKATGKKIAVIGGGPASISCAYFLGLQGHNVTLYEKGNRCGGAMSWGIPKYRLPKDLMVDEINARLEETGVTLLTNKEITNFNTLKKEFDAIFIGIGAIDSYKLGVEGEDSSGVMDFRELLTEVNVNNNSPKMGQRVAIIGGGNSSIDAARVSKRLGASNVVMYYRRTEREMPASPHEIQGALQEGISFEYLVAPVKIHPGEPLKLELQNMTLGEPDASGRRRPVPVPGGEYIVEVDTIVKAIGQSVVVPADFGVEVNRQGRIVVNDAYETSLKGVYAGGDVVFGPSSVIESLRDGRKAASSMDTYLGGKGLPEPTVGLEEYVPRQQNLEEIRFMPKVDVRELNPEERIKRFEEIELGYDNDEAVREATRCWRCNWNE